MSTAVRISWPFVQNPGVNHCSLVWFTHNLPGPHRVVALSRDWPAESRAFGRLERHEARVSGLEPGVAVRCVASSGRSAARAILIRGAPAADEPVRLLLASDAHGAPAFATAMRRAAGATGPLDAVLLAGDLTDDPERPEAWAEGLLGSLAPLWRGRPAPVVLPAPGNHDIRDLGGDWNLGWYEEFFSLPSGEGNGRYYALRLGDAFIVSLTVTRRWLPEGEGASGQERTVYEPIGNGSDQLRWLEKCLRSPDAHSARLRLVMLHHPIFGSGHDRHIPFGLGGRDDLLEHLLPVLERGAVNVVLNGHNHIVEHTVRRHVHFVESSHFDRTLGLHGAAQQLHKVAPRLSISRPGGSFFSVLDTGGEGTLTITDATHGRELERHPLGLTAGPPKE